MKNFLKIFILVVLILGIIGAGGYFGYQYLHKDKEKETPVDFSSMTYVALGDSITFGADYSRSYAQMDFPYCELVKEELGLKDVKNYGISGTCLTTCRGVSDAMSVRYKNMQNDAQIVSVLGGINDFNNDTNISAPLGTIEDTDVSTIYGALNTLAKGLKEKYPNAFIFFMTPMAETSKWYPKTATYTLVDLSNAIKKVAEKYNFAVLDLYNDCPFEKEMTQSYSDGLHPTQEFVKTELAPVISKFIKNNYKAK